MHTVDFDLRAAVGAVSLTLGPLARQVYVAAPSFETLGVLEVLDDDATDALEIAVVPGGTVELSLLGTPHRRYALARSTDLRSWTTLSSGAADEGGELRLSSPVPAALDAAFYRGESDAE